MHMYMIVFVCKNVVIGDVLSCYMCLYMYVKCYASATRWRTRTPRSCRRGRRDVTRRVMAGGRSDAAASHRCTPPPLSAPPPHSAPSHPSLTCCSPLTRSSQVLISVLCSRRDMQPTAVSVCTGALMHATVDLYTRSSDGCVLSSIAFPTVHIASSFHSFSSTPTFIISCSIGVSVSVFWKPS